MALAGPITVSNLKVYTKLEADSFPAVIASDIITLCYVLDRNTVYEWDGNSWLLIKKSGNIITYTTSTPLTELSYGDGGTYVYTCTAQPTTAKATASWKVMRETIADGTKIYAGTGLFEHSALDLSTVAALTYTLA